MYSDYVYYVATVADLVMRFVWTLTLIPFSENSPLGSYMAAALNPFLASVELVRRAMWSCLRLEAEHLRNTEGFRSVDFIPLHFNRDVGDDSEKDKSQTCLFPNRRRRRG